MPDIRVQLSLDEKGAIKGIKAVEGGLEGLDSKAKKSQAAFEDYGKKLALAFGTTAVAALAAAVASLDKVLVASGRLSDMSAKTGIAAESLQKLEAAAKLGGNSLEQVTGAVGKMQKAIVEGDGVFQRLGLSIDALRNMKPEDQFAAVAAQIAKIEDPAQRAAAAMEVFGKSGAELLPTLTANIKGAGDEAERLGQIMSNETVAAADKLGDSVDVLKGTWGGLIQQVGGAIAQSAGLHKAVAGLTEIIAGLSRMVSNNRDVLIDWTTTAVSFAIRGLSVLVQAVAVAKDAYTNFRLAFSGVQADALQQQIGNLNPNLPNEAARIRELRAELTALQRERSALMQSSDADLQKIMGLVQQLDDLAASVKASGRETVVLTEDAKQLGGSLTFVSKAAADATEKLAKLMGAGVIPQPRGGLVDDLLRLNPLPALTPGTSGLIDTPGAQITGMQAWQAWLAKYGAKNAADAKKAGLATGSGFGEGFARALDGLPDVILRALEGGGDVGKSVGAHLGRTLGESLQGVVTSGLSKILGSAIGTALGAAMPAIGAALGAVAGEFIGKFLSNMTATKGKIVGALLGGPIGFMLGGFLGGQAENKRVNDLRDAFISAAGGLDVLRQRAFDAGLTLDRLLDAKKVKDYEAAIDELTDAFDLQKRAQEKLDATIAKYGFTIEELGPKWGAQKLNEKALELFEDYQLLIGAGIEYDAVIARMGPAINDYIQTAIGAGIAIPEAWRPIIQRMIENKQLLDKNGVAYENLEETGIEFSESLNEQFKKLLDSVQKLIDVLNGLDGKTINTYVNTNYRENRDGGQDSGGNGGKGGETEAAFGWHGTVSGPASGYPAPFTMHGTERVDIAPLSASRAGTVSRGASIQVGEIVIQVSGAGDPVAVARAVKAALRDNVEGLATQLR